MLHFAALDGHREQIITFLLEKSGLYIRCVILTCLLMAKLFPKVYVPVLGIRNSTQIHRKQYTFNSINW